MLASLMINNVVLIDRLSIHFENGLCALTGETGAGKSILLDYSLGLALGARSESGLVRKEADQAIVAAEFDVPVKHPVFALLKEQGMTMENPLILRRLVNENGKSRAFINDHPVSVSLLKQVGEMLVEIHGQFDTQTLLNPRVHRGLLDEYTENAKEISALEKIWQQWAEARDVAAKKQAMERARSEELYLRSALEQLDELQPKEGEEDKLTSLRSRLMKREQILESLSGASHGAEQAQTILNTIWRALEKSGDDTKSIMDSIDRANSELQDAAANIEAMSLDLSESEYSLTEIDDRLFALKAQARKHACSVDELPAKHEELSALLNTIGQQEDMLNGLEKEVQKARADYIARAKIISAQRKTAAQKLDKLVAKELVPLKLEKARFETSVEDLAEEEWGPSGTNRVQFLVATNPGSSAGALNKIASGGELARFMLALKVVLAEVGVAGTLVFDEVDSGIGGATADAVGERLARLSTKRQILVVTHSPQVAARAAHHWIVAKTGKTNPTTKVIPLSKGQERQEEIARMLAGAEITHEARAAASKLLEKSAA